jgi:hypothetical protein
LDRGQADIYDYKLRRTLRRIYGDAQPGENLHEWSELGMKALFHGKPTLLRPDVGPLLDEWEARVKEIASRKSGGKAPLQFPRQARSVPFASGAVGKRKMAAGSRQAKRKPGQH